MMNIRFGLSHHDISQEFSYLSDKDHYFDTACQSIRPQSVIEAEQEYYQQYNACAGRSSYDWAKQVDQRVAKVRKRFLQLLKLSDRTYRVFFGLNTTSGINQILWGIDWSDYQQIVTSEIEHNSVFVPTLKVSQAQNIPRRVLQRSESGDLLYERKDLRKSVVIVNTTSNIDGRKLGNLSQLIKDTHRAGGRVILDVCQTMGHDPAWLQGIQADALLMSGHKMYGPTLGIGIIRYDLMQTLNPLYLGGGTVTDVNLDSYDMVLDESSLEPGLQNWAAIWAMDGVLDFYRKLNWNQEVNQARELHATISELPHVVVLSDADSPVQTFYIDGLDSHLVGKILARHQVMVRVGYFCCHYYLIHVKHYPPLVRVSLGLHTSEHDLFALKQGLQEIQRLI